MSTREEPRATSPKPLQLLLLAGAVTAAALLVAEHFGAMALPGCGPESACARAAASAFGKVPGLGWPVSFVGASWFAGLLAWRLTASGAAGPLLLWALRAGAAASLLFVVVMATGGYLCPYCLVVHGANLGFWGLAEREAAVARSSGRAGPGVPLAPVGVGLAVALLAGVGLGLADGRVRERVDAEQEEQLAASTAEIVGRTSHGETRPADDAPEDGSAALPAFPAFMGRWPQGPDPAAVRVVVFSDYQCPDCRKVEFQLREIEKQGLSVSISMKHYPMCTDCNPHTNGQNPHPNACWAARAAEAAGLLGGGEAFHAMHRWLFEVKGSFTNPELFEQVSALGFDHAEFRAAMEGPETLARVRADVEEGRALGIHFTPMVFLNGVELRGVFADNAVRRAIEEVHAAGPEPRSADGDRPPYALEKYVGDWREGERHELPDAHPRWLGDEDAPLSVVVFGDHRDEGTAELDAALRAWVAEHPGEARYDYRHFPFETGCNPFVRSDGHPGACRAARAAEAAFLLGGADAYWRVHAWLLAHPDDALEDATLSEVAAGAGLDADELFQTMRAPVEPAIIDDVRAGGPALYRGSIPTLYVDGRVVPRWRAEGMDVLGAVLSAAVAER